MKGRPARRPFFIAAFSDAWKNPRTRKVKDMKGYRTILFNFAAGGLAALGAMDVVSLGALAPWMPIIITVGNVGLRMMTTTPVGQSN